MAILHRIFNEKNILPDEICDKPQDVKDFIYASFLLYEEDKMAYLKKNRKKGG